VFTAGDLTRKRKSMKPSTDNLKVASQSQTLVLMGDFSHPHICWKDNTARPTSSRRFLHSTNVNFSIQVREKPTRRGVLLDLVLTNKGRTG